jgi:IS5 family transposase
MRALRITQRSIFDSRYVDHEVGQELAAMSGWLDAHPRLLALVASDLSPGGRSRLGRQALPVELVLRCAILKQYRQVSYRELEFLLKDSRSFAHFVRLGSLRVPRFSTLQSAVSRIRAETWEALNQALLTSARSEGVESAQQIRFDATVTETHILRPSDSRLLFDGVRVMVRLLVEAQRYLGDGQIIFHNHRRVAKRRHRAIGSARGPERRAELYVDLVASVERTLGYLERARPAVARCPELWAIVWLREADHYRGLIERVIDQVRRRVFDGATVPASDKVVSLFEPHTDIIIKGGREVEYGHKVTLSTGKSGLVLDAVIETGNPPDTICFLPMLNRHIAQHGRIEQHFFCKFEVLSTPRYSPNTRYRFSAVCQSSAISMITAVTRRRQEASFGKSLATRVRRRISSFSRSTKFVVRSRRRWVAGNANTVKPCGSASSAHGTSFGAFFA